MDELSVSFDFEGGSGTLVEVNPESKRISIDLGQEGLFASHGFALSATTSRDLSNVTVTIRNAWQSPFARGWVGYRSYFQDQSGQWHRIDNGTYDGKQYSFRVGLCAGSTMLAWFPQYHSDRLSLFVEDHKLSNWSVEVEEGITQLRIGTAEKPTVLIVARQHPGESMASFCIEGLLSKVSDLDGGPEAQYVIFPMLNMDGLRGGRHRLDCSNVDLNRAWDRDDILAIARVRRAIEGLKHLALVIDVHGDEVSKINYYMQVGQSSSWPKDNYDSPSPDVVALAHASRWRRAVRELLRTGRLRRTKGMTLAEFSWNVLRVPAITLEISAHVADEKDALRIGQCLYEWIEARLSR